MAEAYPNLARAPNWEWSGIFGWRSWAYPLLYGGAMRGWSSAAVVIGWAGAALAQAAPLENQRQTPTTSPRTDGLEFIHLHVAGGVGSMTHPLRHDIDVAGPEPGRFGALGIVDTRAGTGPVLELGAGVDPHPGVVIGMSYSWLWLGSAVLGDDAAAAFDVTLDSTVRRRLAAFADVDLLSTGIRVGGNVGYAWVTDAIRNPNLEPRELTSGSATLGALFGYRLPVLKPIYLDVTLEPWIGDFVPIFDRQSYGINALAGVRLR